MVQRFVRPEVRGLYPYICQPKITKYKIILDGNENPYPIPRELQKQISERLVQLELNRYPDPSSHKLCSKIAEYLDAGIDSRQILVGNGSDEIISFIMQTFIQSGDRVLALSPTFSMYKIFTSLAGGIYAAICLGADGTLDLEQFWSAVETVRPKMIFLCSPNNPTGTLLPLKTLTEIAAKFSGIVVFDEAYAEFTDQSMISLLSKYPNMIITRTFSKALGLAGIRLGYMVSSQALIAEVGKVIPPYVVNSVSQMIGEVIFDSYEVIKVRIQEIIWERERLTKIIQELPDCKVWPSEANFLFLQGRVIPDLTAQLANAGIKVRKFENPFKDAIRMTVGTPKENDQVINVVMTLKERWGDHGSQM